jgi:hypothetical protein
MLMMMIMIIASAFASGTVYNDDGGQIGAYLAKYKALRASGERVVIDDTCASACTMLLGMISRNRITDLPAEWYQMLGLPAQQSHADSIRGLVGTSRVRASGFLPQS